MHVCIARSGSIRGHKARVTSRASSWRSSRSNQRREERGMTPPRISIDLDRPYFGSFCLDTHTRLALHDKRNHDSDRLYLPLLPSIQVIPDAGVQSVDRLDRRLIQSVSQSVLSVMSSSSSRSSSSRSSSSPCWRQLLLVALLALASLAATIEAFIAPAAPASSLTTVVSQFDRRTHTQRQTDTHRTAELALAVRALGRRRHTTYTHTAPSKTPHADSSNPSRHRHAVARRPRG
jgi:hypothetical protein